MHSKKTTQLKAKKTKTKKISTRKGQILSTDFIISVIIFFVIITMFFFLYDYVQEKNDMESTQYRMYRESKAIGNMLVNIEGYPSDWTPSTVKSLGCGNENNMLNATKLQYLRQISYYKLKHLFALVNSDNFFINISFVNGTEYMSVGRSYYGAESITSSLRYGVLELGSLRHVVEVKVVVWA